MHPHIHAIQVIILSGWDIYTRCHFSNHVCGIWLQVGNTCEMLVMLIVMMPALQQNACEHTTLSQTLDLTMACSKPYIARLNKKHIFEV
eukprot:5041398-Amphidinium_carterae.1